MFDMIKQCYEWGVYTPEYVKSFFVDEYHSITQEQYEQITNEEYQADGGKVSGVDSAPEAPTDVTSTATNDGAVITSK